MDMNIVDAFDFRPASEKKSKPKTDAQRSKDYRTRLKEQNLTAVKIYLDAESVAYLRAIASLHGATLSEAGSLAFRSLIRGEVPAEVDLPVISVPEVAAAQPVQSQDPSFVLRLVRL